MKVFDDAGVMVAESPSREPEDVAREALAHLGRQDQSPMQVDAANLAPVSIELEAVRLYAETGSLAAVSRRLGIAIYQLQKLQRTEWWQSELSALRRETLALKNAKLEQLHGMALEQLEDRLQHGDYVAVGKHMVRVKLTAKDLARVSETVFKQRQLLLGEPTEIRANKQLEALRDKLRALGQRDPVEAARIIDAEVVDVSPHDQGNAEPMAQTSGDTGWASGMPADQCTDSGADPSRGDK